MELLNRFIENWAKQGFVKQNVVLAAVSGGIDSMTLVNLLLRARIPFAIAHCNFQLRAEDSDEDEDFVRNWAIQKNVPFHSIRFNTKLAMEERKSGVQETARILRYEWFERIREEYGYAYIATAHNANDNTETLLINLFKGTGISGLHGIATEKGVLIRPLLFAEKKDILQYAETNNISYREDVSNATDNYLRNAVRHHVITKIEEWFPGVVKQINDSIERFSEAELIYNSAIEQLKKKLIKKRGNDFYVSINRLKNYKPLSTIVYELFKVFGYTSQQGPHIINLLDSDTGHYIESETHRVINNRGFLIVTSRIQNNADILVIDAIPCTASTGSFTFIFNEKNNKNTIPDDMNVASIDISKLIFPLLLRKWKQGDYFYPLGMGMKKKKLSKFFIDNKVPFHLKENIWILESDKRIVWVAGMRLDERFKITDKTTTILRVEAKPV